MKALRWIVLFSFFVFLLACGKDPEGAKSPDKDPSLDDALALLPGNAIAVGTVDARAFFGSQSFGADLGKLVEKYMPLGPEAGFLPSRDVDRVTFASYSYSGVDVAAIVIGRFDSAKIKQVAASQTPTKAGAPIVVSQYGGRDVYTVSNVGFTLLSDTRAIVGTESGIRRVIERIKDKRVQRDITGWMIATVETPGAVLAVAADLATQPMPAEAVRQLPGPIAQNVRAARVLATFNDGLQVAGSLTYPDGSLAENSAASLKQAAHLSQWLAIVGVRVQKFDIKVDKSDVQLTLGVDDQSLRQLLASAPQWLGP
ncbi:MAG: hypothetical protein KF819_39205 [Labilithrix sp.]|nr:hypothetical protein [Labilithrix sp.]